MAHSALECAKTRYKNLTEHIEDTPVEKEIAGFYLREKYSGIKFSSNRKELQDALRYLEHHAAEYDEAEIQESREILDNFQFHATVGHIKRLLKRATSNHYKAVEDDEEDLKIHAHCLSLFEKDYNVEILENPGGVLSWNYPLKMIIPTSEKIPEKQKLDPESSCEVGSYSGKRSNESTLIRRPGVAVPDSVELRAPIKTMPCSIGSSFPVKIEPSSSNSITSAKMEPSSSSRSTPIKMDTVTFKGSTSIETKSNTSGARPKQKTEKSLTKHKKGSTSARTQRKPEKEVKKSKKIGQLQLPPRSQRTVRVVYATKQSLTKLIWPEEYEAYSNMAKQAAVARCKNRFPVPVILCNGKYICRSGTLAVRKGVAFGTLTQPSGSVGQEEYEGLFSYIWGGVKNLAEKGKRTIVNVKNSLKMLLSTSMDEIKDRDVRVLKCLDVRYICDLMVENRTVRSGIRVSSSEKINLEKYGVFTNLKIPYPGCEFFKKYHLAGRKAQGLKFDWTSPEIESSIGIVKKDQLPLNDINWENYMDWDIVYQTQVYLRLILHFLAEGDGSVLVHCISGWDRTPLFISLIRLSLWADGAIHTSLNHIEIIFLTLAYDWYLFGHDLPTRIRRKEEILHFCFNVLPFMSVEHFARENLSSIEDITESESFAVLNELQGRINDSRNKLKEIKEIVLGYYEEMVKME